MAHPPEIAALAESLGRAGRAAVDSSEDLLEGLAVLGDRTTQDAVDGLVDEAAGLLRQLAATCAELTLGLAGATGAPGAARAPGPVGGTPTTTADEPASSLDLGRWS